MILAVLQFQRIPSIGHFLHGKCIYNAFGQSYQHEECAVELSSAQIDHFSPLQLEKLTITGMNGQKIVCLSGKPCATSGQQLSKLGMCQFSGFALDSNLTARLQTPVRFDHISHEVVTLSAVECGANVEISGLHYGKRQYSYLELLQTATLILVLHAVAAFFALKAGVVFMENQALSGELPGKIMVLQVNVQQVMIFLISESSNRRHGFERLHMLYVSLAICIHIPGLVMLTLVIFRTNRFRDIASHAVKSALVLLSKLWFLFLYVFLQFNPSQFINFAIPQIMLCSVVLYFSEFFKVNYGHQVYARYLLSDICRSEALLMYYFGFDNYLGGKKSRAYAVVAYLVAIWALWEFARHYARQRSPVYYQAEFSTDIIVLPANYQEFAPQDGFVAVQQDLFAVAVQDCSLQCQNPLHVHPREVELQKQLLFQLQGLKLAEFDSRCYVLVLEDFFHQLCPICLEEMQFQLEQLAVCKMKSDRETELGHLSERLGVQLGDQQMAQLKCGHIFHVHCILAWLGEKNECPKCRCPTG